MKTAKRLDTLEFSKIRMMSAKVTEMEAQGKKVYRFTLGQPDFLTPDYIKEACKQAIDSLILSLSFVFFKSLSFSL